MKIANLIQWLKQGHFVVPLYLFQRMQSLSLTMEEFVFLMYLLSQGEQFPFNPNKIKKDLNYELTDVMRLISTLTDKKMLMVQVSKNDKGIMEEQVDLSLFYDKVSLVLAEENNQPNNEENENIYEIFEKEFGRPLSPMEYEIIKAWIDGNMARELIIRALKEATYNGVSNLRYIDKILYEWDRKGFKTVEDVEKHEKSRREKKDKPKVDSFDYNWFDEEDDEE